MSQTKRLFLKILKDNLSMMFRLRNLEKEVNTTTNILKAKLLLRRILKLSSLSLPRRKMLPLLRRSQ
jgi:hypothetical protein